MLPCIDITEAVGKTLTHAETNYESECILVFGDCYAILAAVRANYGDGVELESPQLTPMDRFRFNFDAVELGIATQEEMYEFNKTYQEKQAEKDEQNELTTLRLLLKKHGDKINDLTPGGAQL
jgi:hypothetical protein